MKRVLTAMIVAFSMAAASGCGASNKQAPQPTAAPESKPAQTLSIGIMPDVDSIPLVIAKQQGYFEKEGVTVNLESFKSAMDRDSALQAGKIDGAISDVLAAAFAKEGGFDVKITSKTDGSYKLLVNKDAKISSLSDLKGKSIAISKNTLIEYTTDLMVQEGKIKPEDLNKQIIKDIPARLEMLQQGKIDAATLPEPLASVAIKNGAKLLNSSDKLGIRPGILLFTTKTLQGKSTEVKAFYKAYNQAVEYLQKEPVDKYIDMLIKDNGFPEAVKGTITVPSYTKAAMIQEKDFDNVIKWLKEKQLIKNDYKFKDLADEQFIK